MDQWVQAFSSFQNSFISHICFLGGQCVIMTLGSLLSWAADSLAFNNQATVYTNKVLVWLLLGCVCI